ncbi:Rha family transcriptional regulator [Pseudomonas azotoformans]
MLTHINEITMTSVEIAAMTGKQHKNVLRDADRIVEQVAHLKSEAGSVEATTTMLTTNQTELLPIVIEGQTFKPNEDGMWSLNAIHQTLALDPAKIASKWNNEIRTALDQSRNFVIERGGANPGTWATEAGTIAYAMWVSPDFYLMVIHAFVAMRNDSILRARMALLAAADAESRLATAVPKVDLVDRRLLGIGVPWNEACRMAGVTKPQLAKRYLVQTKAFVCLEHPTEYRQILKPKASGFEGGWFKYCSTQHGNDDGFRVTAKGLSWLQGKAMEINTAIADRARKKASDARAKRPKKVTQ